MPHGSQRQWNDLVHDGDQWWFAPPPNRQRLAGPYPHLLAALKSQPVQAARAAYVRRPPEPSPNVNTVEPSNDTLDLRRVTWVVRTTTTDVVRKPRVADLFATLGVTDWRFDEAVPTKPYWKDQRHQVAAILRSTATPFVLAEDDIAVRAWSNHVDPPRNADVLSLGGGRTRLRHGLMPALAAGFKLFFAHGYGYQPFNARWIRIFGQWYTHALLILNQRSALSIADALSATPGPIDSTTARLQHKYQWYCSVTPFLWQNDGHHEYATWDYAPKNYVQKHGPLYLLS